jgi:hypothetical protein
MAVKSLRSESRMDHTFGGVRVADMSIDELKEAQAMGLDPKVIAIYHEPVDSWGPVLKGVSATAKKAIMANYDSLDALRADVVGGTLATVKGVSQKAADTVASNLEKI